MKKTVILLLLIACISGRIASAQTVSGEAPRFRVAVQGGYGYRLGKVQESGQDVIDQHNKKLKWGFVYGADATWFVANDLGFGLKFSNLRSKAEDAVSITYDDGSSKSGMYRDVVDLRFLGAVASTRSVTPSGRWIFLVDCGLGYLSLVNNGRIIDPMAIKGSTLGFCADAGVDFRLMNKLYLGLSINAISGTLSSYSLTHDGRTETIKLDKDEYETLHHLTASIGLRLYL